MWHTEHADKDCPPDFLVIACLRNPDGVGTRVSRPIMRELDKEDVCCLTTPTAFEFMSRAASALPIGVWEQGRLRYDPVYCRPRSALAARALQQLADAVERSALIAPQAPGCALIIPNRHTVHAREGFHARYDGTDRWLLRTMIRAD
ncbi:MAG: TauD/TfdA family dioxygenase [Deltaproteobacteria bacterium]|nr:TauD/TfdA family dioxygenase [Deltaproteobacteria bacterium]